MGIWVQKKNVHGGKKNMRIWVQQRDGAGKKDLGTEVRERDGG